MACLFLHVILSDKLLCYLALLGHASQAKNKNIPFVILELSFQIPMLFNRTF